MQPGDNYRVVASVVDQSMITGVQATTSTAGKYLGPALAQNAGSPASPLLTVWRRLWVENDSMAAIPVDPFGYKRNDLSSDLNLPTILTKLSDGINTSFGIPTITDQSSFGTLDNGRIILQNAEHPVIGTTLFGDTNFVQITGDFSSLPLGSEFRLYDDDDFGLDAPALPRIDLVNDDFKNVYKPAFIEVIDANTAGYNLSKYVPFHQNYPPALGIGIYTSPGIWDNTVDLTDFKPLWVARIITGYQSGEGEDSDPNIEGNLEGGTPASRKYSVIYMEAIRDNSDNYLRTPTSSNGIEQQKILIKRFKSLTAAHEVGHMPGGGNESSHHDEQGLMGDGGYINTEKFTANSIHRFRGTSQWFQP